MPEGPEIHRIADKLTKAIAQRPIQEIFFAFPALQSYATVLAESQVIQVQAQGKALLTRFACGLNIYSHNQLYGTWMIRKPYQFPATKRQLRLAIHSDRASALLYSASDIEVLNGDEVLAHPFLSNLGPDVLDPEVTEAQVCDRLLSREFARRRLATLLLDQHCLSGLGNYLRSEILFVASIHPLLRPVDCTDQQILDLAKAAIALPRQSYQTGGLTNDLDRVADLKNKGWPRWSYRHHVFNRQDQACFSCGSTIEKHVFGGRRCYICPQCQAH